MDHIGLCSCVSAALSIESSATALGWRARDRWEWLTEAEFVARIHAAIPGTGVDAAEVKVAAQGRRGAGVTQYDLEIGRPLSSAIEVVFTFARRAPSPAAPINGDIGWMLQAPGSHVVMVIPRLAVGYKVQNNPAPFDLQGGPVQVSADEMLLSDALQVGGLDTSSLQALDGVVVAVPTPARGRLPKWTVAPNPSDASLNINGMAVERTVCGDRSDLIWAVVLSRQ